jgi:hypothetical protein
VGVSKFDPQQQTIDHPKENDNPATKEDYETMHDYLYPKNDRKE